MTDSFINNFLLNGCRNGGMLRIKQLVKSGDKDNIFRCMDEAISGDINGSNMRAIKYLTTRFECGKLMDKYMLNGMRKHYDTLVTYGPKYIKYRRDIDLIIYISACQGQNFDTIVSMQRIFSDSIYIDLCGYRGYKSVDEFITIEL